MELKLTQKNFDSLVDGMNHKFTSIDKSINNITNDLKWIKWMMCGISGIITINLIGGLL